MKSKNLPNVLAVFVAFFAAVPGAQATTDFSFIDNATYVPRISIELTMNKQYKIETVIDTGQFPYGDTVLHLLDGSDTEVAQDDDSGAGLAAQIIYTAPVTGDYTVITRAYSGLSAADCTVNVYEWNGSAWSPYGTPYTTRFAGVLVSVGSVPASTEIHAVISRDGANDPLLFFLEYKSASGLFEIVKLDDDSGVEYGARLTTSTAASDSKVLMATAVNISREGITTIYLNSPSLNDTDSDGLSNALEQQLGLCYNLSTVCPGSITDLTPNGNPQDTDGDGLTDYIEIIGKDHGAFPQLLPKWGADPRHKDIFVEIDQDTSINPATSEANQVDRLTEAEASEVAARYADVDLMNPDSTKGIRVHLDIGQPCGQGVDGTTDICGNLCAFEGSSFSECGEDISSSLSYATHFHTARQGVFHWMRGQSTNKGGQGYPVGDWIVTCTCWPNIAHELGHNVGISHAGDIFSQNAQNLNEANCKPNYPSLMNYLFEYSLNGSTNNLRFSDGKTGGKLDPMEITETDRLGASADDVSYLEKKPLLFDLVDCTINGSKKSNCKVDWNRDGQINTNQVRSYVSPTNATFDSVCGGPQANALPGSTEDILSSAPLTENGTAAASFTVGTTEFLYTVYTERANPARIMSTRTPALLTGGWQTAVPISTASFRSDTQPAAVPFEVSSQSRLYVFATASGSSPVRYAYIDDQGAVSDWSQVPGQPFGLAARDVSVAEHEGRLYIVAFDEADFANFKIYVASMDDQGGWSAWEAAKEGTQVVRACATPGLASAPDGKLYMLVPNLDGDATCLLTLYEPTADGWADSSIQHEGDDLTEYVTFDRPAMHYMNHLRANGSHLLDDRGYLAMWWNRVYKNRPFYATTWGAFTASSRSVTFGHPTKYEANCFIWLYYETSPAHRTSPALAQRGDRLVAMLPQKEDTSPSGPCGTVREYMVRHVAYADGIGPAEPAEDNNDGATMGNFLCAALNYKCKNRCQDFNATACTITSPIGEAIGPCRPQP